MARASLSIDERFAFALRQLVEGKEAKPVPIAEPPADSFPDLPSLEDSFSR